MVRLVIACLMAVLGWLGDARGDDAGPAAVFEQRIMPIFKSSDPSSCIQCHLSSVDLKDYIRPSSRETFLSLRDQGLINLEKPRDSKILQLIAMGESDPDSLAQRIHAKNRKAEYEAFATWIDSCCQDHELISAESTSHATPAGPGSSLEVIRHTRKDRVLDSFVRNIWSQRMRCFPCHTPSELDSNNPMHAEPTKRYRDFVAQYGARMAIFKESPEKTLQSLVASSRKQKADRLPLINLTTPLESLLLLKPTAKLPPKDSDGKPGKPSSSFPVSHMGGIKMHKDDHSYKAFAAWLDDYARSVSGDYPNPQSLPADNWFPTEHVLRIKGLPADWPALATAQIFVHRWDSARDAWRDEPVAFTQCKVTPRKILNGSLFVIAGQAEKHKLNPEGEALRPGKVQLRIYLDRDEVLAKDPLFMLNRRVPDVTAVIQAKFEKGFQNADIIEGNQLTHDNDES